MGRASGKHPQRGKDPLTRLLDDLKARPGPDEPEGYPQYGGGELAEYPQGGREETRTPGMAREEGEGDGYHYSAQRLPPGGQNHLGNEPTVRQAVPVPEREWPYRRALLAHGVNPDGQTYDRDPRLTGQARGTVKPTEPGVRQSPVPVFIVTGEDPGTLRSASPRRITCPASTNPEPARICGKNPGRTEIRLLNEDTATNIRFAQRPSDLTGGGGALLPWPSNTYLALATQDELYAIGATGSGTPLLSIIEVFDLKEGL